MSIKWRKNTTFERCTENNHILVLFETGYEFFFKWKRGCTENLKPKMNFFLKKKRVY